jgi:hypothetical protein
MSLTQRPEPMDNARHSERHSEQKSLRRLNEVQTFAFSVAAAADYRTAKSQRRKQKFVRPDGMG